MSKRYTALANQCRGVNPSADLATFVRFVTGGTGGSCALSMPGSFNKFAFIPPRNPAPTVSADMVQNFVFVASSPSGARGISGFTSGFSFVSPTGPAAHAQRRAGLRPLGRLFSPHKVRVAEKRHGRHRGAHPPARRFPRIAQSSPAKVIRIQLEQSATIAKKLYKEHDKCMSVIESTKACRHIR